MDFTLRDGKQPQSLGMDLSSFTGEGLDRGRPRYVEALWQLAKLLFIQSAIPWPSALRRRILVVFGAKVGRGFYMRPSVNIHFPWKLEIGDNVWIGDGCTILNLEPVKIMDNSALAHQVYVSTGNHDIEKPHFPYANHPVTIESSVWIGTRAYIGAGVTVRSGAVVAAGAVVVKDVEPWSIAGGVPARCIGHRSFEEKKGT